ncbi:MAG: dinitrogenase iron-molybdenum cofactor biosynthesis protein [Clostridia bacterium]|nr:dinitrogenase iron-molybdenum cofactor biosynthesis protein [Clostridia bacterium]
MKIAITYKDGQVFQHFGHTEQFKIYNLENGEIVSSKVISTQGSGHSALAGMLAILKVEALICGGIGGGARDALDKAGIRIYGGVKGDADAAALSLAKGELLFDPDAKCDHHDHEHTCGEHTCGEHTCH